MIEREGPRSWWWQHYCNGKMRIMGKDMGWVRDGRERRWIECIRCGEAIDTRLVK